MVLVISCGSYPVAIEEVFRICRRFSGGDYLIVWSFLFSVRRFSYETVPLRRLRPELAFFFLLFFSSLVFGLRHDYDDDDKRRLEREVSFAYTPNVCRCHLLRLLNSWTTFRDGKERGIVVVLQRTPIFFFYTESFLFDAHERS